MFESLSGPPWVLVLIVLAVIVGIFVSQKKKKYGDIDLPIPATRRADLLYGYYSSLDRSYDQTKDHINLFWFSHFFGLNRFIDILRETDCKIVVDLATYLFQGSGKRSLTVREDAEQNVRNFFTALRNEGLLHKLTYLYPSDEPNLFVKSAEEHLKAINIVKKVRAEFEELAASKLAVIYAGGGYWMNINEFDVVGVDNYDQKSEILTKGDHKDLVDSLRPGQKTMLVPGPGFGHEPGPWVAYALLNPNEVEAVVPFIWFDDPNHKDVDYTGLEGQPQEFRDKWLFASKICMNRA